MSPHATPILSTLSHHCDDLSLVRTPHSDRLASRLTIFGQRVRDARLNAGLSQERLADLAGLHRTYIGSIERGERNLAVGNCYALADALNVSVTTLLPD
jgi:DNA-binding XRE family transcriptional regulator